MATNKFLDRLETLLKGHEGADDDARLIELVTRVATIAAREAVADIMRSAPQARGQAMIRYRPDWDREQRGQAMIRYRPDWDRQARGQAMIRYRPDWDRQARGQAMIRYRPDWDRQARGQAMIRYRPDWDRQARGQAMIRYRPDWDRQARGQAMIRYRPDLDREQRAQSPADTLETAITNLARQVGPQQAAERIREAIQALGLESQNEPEQGRTDGNE